MPAEPKPNPTQKAAFMAKELVAHNKPVFDQLHPNIYRTAIGLVAWFGLAAWILFDRQSDIALPLAMISVLLLIAVLLPWSMSLVWKKHLMPHQQNPNATSFHDWKAGDFAVWGSKLPGVHAAIDMLLPLAAVAFGLTALGIVFLICADSRGYFFVTL
jgi:Mn2+/Fe2+ NRAMP family transporter